VEIICAKIRKVERVLIKKRASRRGKRERGVGDPAQSEKKKKRSFIKKVGNGQDRSKAEF